MAKEVPQVLLFIFLFVARSSGIAAEQDLPAPAPPGKLVDVNGRRVHIYCTGQGSPAVVVVSGGFSVDWGLIQPAVAGQTQVCTYDPAGVAWSDPLRENKAPTCAERVDELQALLHDAHVRPPYVVVGYSIGGLVARLYAASFPEQIAGLVLVDHAFIDTPQPNHPPASTLPTEQAADRPAVLIYRAPISLDLIDDANFSKLPLRDQEAHKWALAIHSFRPTPELAAQYFAELKKAETQVFPLRDKPVAVVSTAYDSPEYKRLQDALLALSRNSKQFMAENSTHMVTIDQPETVTLAIAWVVNQVRSTVQPRAR
jgi:pimeloyl-ACP methyl ester carboxylesterase